MKIYVSRHGQTNLNAVDKVCGGATDVPLSEKGREQAEMLAHNLADVKLDIIFASDMIRAQQTANRVANDREIEIITDKRIRERHYGCFEGHYRTEEEYKIRKRDFANRLENGESLIDVAIRVYSFLDEIIDKYNDKTVLIVCHASMMRVLNSYFVSVTNDEFFEFDMDNCQVAEYEI